MMRSPRRVIARLAAVLVGFLIVLIAAAGPASAHATVVRSTPADGANLSRTPATVSITFDEPVGLRPGYLQVINSTGTRVDAGLATHPGGDGTTVSVALRPQKPGPAGYLASYRVISADSHPVSGVIRFTVGGGTTVTAAPATPATSKTVSVLLDIVTALSYLGLVLAGGAWVLISRTGVLTARRARITVRAGLVTAGAAAVAQFVLQGPYGAGANVTHLLDPTLLHDTLSIAYGRWHLVTLACLAALLAVTFAVTGWTGPLTSQRDAVLAASGAVWLIALLGIAESGHAGIQRPVWLGLLSTVTHLLAMSTWAGGLIMLTVLVTPAAATAAPVTVSLRRFSAVALRCVIALGVTGTYQAWRETKTLTALVSTTYGALVLAKVALYIALVALGSIARRHVQRDHTLRALRRGVAVELAVIAAVLAITSVLVTERPASQAHTMHQADRAATVTVAFDTTRSATIRVDPSHTGPVDVTITLTGVTTVQSLTVTAALPSHDLGPQPVTLHASTARSQFDAHGINLPVAGPWRFELTLRTSQFDSTVADATVPIGTP